MGNSSCPSELVRRLSEGTQSVVRGTPGFSAQSTHLQRLPRLVETSGFEPPTSAMRTQRSPN